MIRRSKDDLDGATFWASDDKPENYTTDPETGLRPGAAIPPHGNVVIDLTDGKTTGAILPTRAKWEQGRWKDKLGDPDDNVWVVDAEGTPGNYEHRHYRLPDSMVAEAKPPHPADWATTKTSTRTTTAAASTAGTLPYAVRFRCVGCGHWYRETTLADHAPICPSTGMNDWAVACECCDSLDSTATVKDGYPRKPIGVNNTEETDGDSAQAPE